MAIRQVNDAIKTALTNADTAAGKCLIRPTISLDDARTIANAVGIYAGDKEIAAIARFVATTKMPPAGQSALEMAMARPRLTAAVREANKKANCEAATQLLSTPGPDPTGGWLRILGGVSAIGCVFSIPANGDDE